MTVQEISISRIKPNPHNARTHSAKQIREIADSIIAFGFTTPLLVSEDGELIVGHGRLEAAKLLAQFAKGDRHARRDLLDLAQKLGIDLKARVERALETNFAAEDEALLADYLKRHGAPAVATNRRSSALRNGRQDEEKEK